MVFASTMASCGTATPTTRPSAAIRRPPGHERTLPTLTWSSPFPAAILIGPEGGFDPEERATIRALPDAVGVELGPRILRAETAAAVAVALWMAAAGDWR